MKRLLVTGASGLLGSNLVIEASPRFDVIAVVHRNPLQFVDAEVRQADLTESATVRSLVREVNPDWIVHCAADTRIDELEEDPEEAYRSNTWMAKEVAVAAATNEARLLHISTDAVFDGRDGPYKESHEPAPCNVYASSKLKAENAVMEACGNALVARMVPFGWRPTANLSLAEWFYTNLSLGKSCPGFTDLFFSPVYATELARIFLHMLNEQLEGIYHIPGDTCLSKYDFGVRLAKTFGFNPELIVPTNSEGQIRTAKRPKRVCLDGEKIMQDLDLRLPSLAIGLAKFRADYENGFSKTWRNQTYQEDMDA